VTEPSGRHRVETTAVSAAPFGAVWQRLADISTWSTWGQWVETTLDREGVPAPDGVGAIRRLRSGRRGQRTTIEEVVAFEPPADGRARFAYELRSGLPLRDYHSEVTLESVGGGTRIRWVSTFDGAYPGVGGIVRLALARFIPETARRLAAAAEADPGR
jgi:polyketide cyclase/dehydrase/lipid transport protein